MEKRINKKIETHFTQFKEQVSARLNVINSEHSFGANDDFKTKMNEMVEFVYEYPRLILQKDDLSKRNRIKNSIPDMNRCNAKRANHEQCTRRRKEGCEFCGTHAKGTPNGLIHTSSTDTSNLSNQKFEVFAQDICGIVYYIDTHSNVYKTEDILSEKQNPTIVAQYVFENNKYSIPSLGLI